MKIEKCYNCGIDIIDDKISREHIPAKNIFRDIDNRDNKAYKNNLIVPACFPCNQKYSKIDQELRDVLGVISNDLTKEKVTEKAFRSIMRRKDWNTRVTKESKNSRGIVNFSREDLEKTIEKNTKGIFYHEFKTPMPKDFSGNVFLYEELNDELFKNVINSLKHANIEGISGNANIFKYKLRILDEFGKDVKDYNNNTQKMKSIVSTQTYYNNFQTLFIATKKE